MFFIHLKEEIGRDSYLTKSLHIHDTISKYRLRSRQKLRLVVWQNVGCPLRWSKYFQLIQCSRNLNDWLIDKSHPQLSIVMVGLRCCHNAFLKVWLIDRLIDWLNNWYILFTVLKAEPKIYEKEEEKLRAREETKLKVINN